MDARAQAIQGFGATLRLQTQFQLARANVHRDALGQPREYLDKCRQRGDLNPCGQSPMDFESITLTTRSHCPGRNYSRKHTSVRSIAPRPQMRKRQRIQLLKLISIAPRASPCPCFLAPLRRSLVRVRVDQHGPCARMARTNRTLCRMFVWANASAWGRVALGAASSSSSSRPGSLANAFLHLSLRAVRTSVWRVCP